MYHLCCFAVKNLEPANPNLAEPARKKPWKETLAIFLRSAKRAFQNKALSLLIVVNFSYNVFVTLSSGLLVYVLSYVFVYDEAQTSMVYLVQGILVILTAILAGCVANKTDKKTVMTGSMLLTIIACLIIGFLPSKSVWLYTYVAIYALGNSGFWTMIYAMSYDSAILEQIETGKKPDGLYTSLIGLFMKFGNALGTLIMGFGLQLIGFSSESETQTEATVQGIKRLFGIAPSIVILVGLIAAIAYPLTKAKYVELQGVLKAKENAGR